MNALMDGVQELYLVLMLVDDRNVTCDSTYFSANGTSYHRVCGRARGYQKGNTHGFNGYHRLIQTSILMTAICQLLVYHLWQSTLPHMVLCCWTV